VHLHRLGSKDAIFGCKNCLTALWQADHGVGMLWSRVRITLKKYLLRHYPGILVLMEYLGDSCRAFKENEGYFSSAYGCLAKPISSPDTLEVTLYRESLEQIHSDLEAPIFYHTF
jgi:hypothetical protein